MTKNGENVATLNRGGEKWKEADFWWALLISYKNPRRNLAMKEPETTQDWQEAVDAAEGALALDSARKYGLVKGGPEVNVSRCEAILERGKKRRVVPAPDAIERSISSLVSLTMST
jgi:hypothetical protein